MKSGFMGALAVTVLLSACATHTYTGRTVAGDTLKSDTFRSVSTFATLQAKCKKVDSVHTEVLAVNPPGTGDTENKKKYGSVDERWTVQLCGQTIPYRVTFTPDGQGGTFFSTSRE
jgi:hypothetical protein